MTGTLGWIVGVLLLIWLIATVAANVPSVRRRYAGHDVAQLLPNWALFARPRVQDMILLRRDVLLDGTLTSWREVEIAGPPHWYNFIWNPDLGPRRAFLALADRLARNARQSDHPTWSRPGQGSPSAIPEMLTVPYVAILKYLTARSDQSVQGTQFMVLSMSNLSITGRYSPTAQGTVLFVSEIHLVRPPVRTWGGDDDTLGLDQLSV